MHSKQELINYYGPTGSHPDYPQEDWRAAVASGETLDGYWGWVTRTVHNEQTDFMEGDADKQISMFR